LKPDPYANRWWFRNLRGRIIGQFNFVDCHDYCRDIGGPICYI